MFRYLLDPRVPLVKKLPVLGWLVYLVSPVDFLPDPVLGLGIVDDFILMLLIISIMNQRLEEYFKGREKGYQNDEEKVIHDVEYEVKHDESDQ